MTSGHCQDHSILREFPICKVLVPRSETGRKPNIKSAGQDSFDLMNGKEVVQLQRHARLAAPEFAKGVYNHSMPGHRSCDPDSKGTRFAMRNPLRANLPLINVSQDTSRV